MVEIVEFSLARETSWTIGAETTETDSEAIGGTSEGIDRTSEVGEGIDRTSEGIDWTSEGIDRTRSRHPLTLPLYIHHVPQ